MKRIALSLFAIATVVSAGYFATSAYFTDTASLNNFTFTTSSADLKFNYCPNIATDCSGTAATLDDLTFVTANVVGPGITDQSCVVIENTGDYLLNLTSLFDVTTANPDGMQDALQVAAYHSDSACNTGGAPIYASQSARSAEAAAAVGVGELDPGERMYVIMENGWNSTGNQNSLQNGTITIDVHLTGTTD